MPREDRLRSRLLENPDEHWRRSNLGAILVQKQQFGEAQQWLDKAYGLRFSLPDNGRRTLMLLHELHRRQTKSPEMAGFLFVVSPRAMRTADPMVIRPPSLRATRLHRLSSPIQALDKTDSSAASPADRPGAVAVSERKSAHSRSQAVTEQVTACCCCRF